MPKDCVDEVALALRRQRTEGFKEGKNDKTPIEWANHLVKAIENARKEGFEAGRKEVGARGRCSVRKTTLTRQEKMIEAQMDEYVPVGKKDLKVIVASIAAQKKFMLVGAEHTHIKRKEGATNAGRK